MSNRVIRRLTDIDHVSLAAADEFVRIAHEACAARKRFTVVMSGGFTPKLLYQHLAEKTYRRQVDWSQVQFFWGDERAVPPDHADSNYNMANHALLEKLALPKTQIHRMQAERSDLDLAASEYQAEIAQVFGVPAAGQPPSFDLVLLGMGGDGHTASLFPNTTALNEKERWVVANSVPKLHAQRMTMTPPLINRAAHVMFLVAGADKAVPLAHVLQGPREEDEYPSQMIQPTSGTITWILDEAAASKLKSE